MGDNTSTASKRGGREAAFWLQYFEEVLEPASVEDIKERIGWRCKLCTWGNRSKALNATRLGEHAIACKMLPEQDFIRFMSSQRWASFYEGYVARNHIAFNRSGFSDRRTEPFFKAAVASNLSKGRENRTSNRSVLKRSFSDSRIRGRFSRTPTTSGDKPPSLKRIRKTSAKESADFVNQKYSEDNSDVRSTLSDVLKPFEDSTIPTINVCGSAEAARLCEKLTRFIVVKMLPFSLVEKDNDGGNLFVEFLNALRPGFVKSFMPSRAKLSDEYLDGFYTEVKTKVSDALSSSLKDNYATLMFDGWKDKVTEESVVNVLLHVAGPDAKYQQTFFIDAIFTGQDKVGATKYVEILENAMKPYGGFSRVCGVVSDSTVATRNARKELQSKYPQFVGVQDQAHAANLLLEDWGQQLPWMRDVIKKAQHVCIEVKSHSKLMAAVKEEKDRFNNALKVLNPIPRDEKDNFGRPSLPRSAVLPTLKVATRFASALRMLRSFLRLRKVLQKIVTLEQFHSNLFQARGSKRGDQKQAFLDTIQSDEFYNQALDVYHVLRVGEAYLRIFDGSKCLVSDVYKSTSALQEELEALPYTSFFDEEKKSKVITIFKNRRSGSPTRDSQVKLLADVHYAAYLLDPTQWKAEDDTSTELRDMFLSYVRKYVAGDVVSREQREELNLGKDIDLRSFIGMHFISIRNLFEKAYQTQDAGYECILWYKESPAGWWKQRAMPPLVPPIFRTFALRTLSLSPSSCAVERSFKAQKRIRTELRNRLSTEKVHKIMYCSWNYSLMNQVKEDVRSVLRRQPIWSKDELIYKASASEWLEKSAAEDRVVNHRLAELMGTYHMDESSPSNDGVEDRYAWEVPLESFGECKSEDESSEGPSLQSRGEKVETRRN